jgi:hypothetical protein
MLEQEIKTYLNAQREAFSDFSSSHTALDFFLPRHNVYIDAKEKRQHFAMQNWKEARMPEEYMFIIDDLAIRKLLLRAPNSFTLVRDSSVSSPMYYVYSIIDFLCIPKTRCRRPIRRTTTAYKGKWVVDLRDAAAFETLADAIGYITAYKKKHTAVFENHIDCWGKYPSEHIGKSGTVRTTRFWAEDAKVHS